MIAILRIVFVAAAFVIVTLTLLPVQLTRWLSAIH
jgi:hypothetical protein